jgi:hypothetical protein
MIKCVTSDDIFRYLCGSEVLQFTSHDNDDDDDDDFELLRKTSQELVREVCITYILVLGFLIY